MANGGVGGGPAEVSRPAAAGRLEPAGLPYTDPELWKRLGEPLTLEAFAQAWLNLQCRIIDGVGRGIVVLGTPEQGPYAPAAFWPEEQGGTPRLAAVVELAMTERRGVVRGYEGGGRVTEVKRGGVELAYPLLIEGQLVGVIAVQISRCDEGQISAVMRQLQWGAAWLEVRYRREHTAGKPATGDCLSTVVGLVATGVEQEHFQAAATAVATELASSLGCDRVSLGFLRGRHIQVLALSHSAHFEHKTNLMRTIGFAMDEAMDQQAVILYPSPVDAAPLVTRAHGELAHQQGGGVAICTVPLHAQGRIIGGLTLERAWQQPFDPETVQLCETAASLLGPILENKRNNDRWLYQKVGSAVQTQLTHLVGPRHVGLKLGTALLTGLLVFLAFATGEYRVAANSTLEGVVQRMVVAPLDGYIGEAYARAGDIVRAGAVLVQLDDRDLKLERLKWAGQKEQYLRQHRDALTGKERAQSQILEAQIAQAEAQMALLDEQLARCQVVAPFAGLVVSGDLSQSLGAPVKRGDVLFQVAPLDHYRVILKVDERDITEVTAGQPGKLALTGEPGMPLPLVVDKVTPVATAEEGRNYFRVEARLTETPSLLRPGMEGVGKIDIGERKLAWIWTHTLLDWLRLKLWSWWP